MVEPNKILLEHEEPLLLETSDAKLHAEIDALKKQLQDQQDKNKKKEEKPEHPKPKTLWLIGLALLIVLVLAFFLGYLPHRKQQNELKKEAREEEQELPRVDFVRAQRSPTDHELMLPGNIQAMTDAPILARADGYVKKRYVDIGDRVVEGQLMAEIEAPDLDQQVRQAQSQVAQAQAAQQQANASLEQAKANEELARVTAVRWDNLVRRGAVSRQENDTYQANYKAQIANVGSLAQAVESAKENVGAAQANLGRLRDLQSYEKVRAPFTGVVTVRNVDVGALIATGNTLLFRVAQIDRLRTYIYVPQPNVPTIQVGQTAELFSTELGSRTFQGTITRTAESLDPTTRTLLTEVQLPNPNHTLLPGMFVQVNLKNVRANPPILIPGSALLVRASGTLVAVLEDYKKVDPEELKKEDEKKQQEESKKSGKDKKKTDKKKTDKTKTDAKQDDKPKEVLDGKIHLQPVSVGRDYGNAMEIYTGLTNGQILISNPNDSVVEGGRVRATETKAQLDEQQAPTATKSDVNTEQLQKKPGAEPIPKQPSRENKTRGPGH